MRKVRVKAATVNNIALPENCNGSVVVVVKKGSGETATISSVVNVYKHNDGTESTGAATAGTAIVAGLAIPYTVSSQVIRVTLSGAPASEDTEIEVLALG